MTTVTVADPTMQAATATEPREYLWTTDRFYQAADAGVFDDPARLELIHGRILEKMPQSPLHRASHVRCHRLLRNALAIDFEIVDECPIHIAFDGEPVPDVVVLRGQGAEDAARHPTPEEVALLVEVAVSTAVSDTGEKALLYAQAGIRDYWVVLAEERVVVVHRGPTIEGYRDVTRVGEDGAIAPLAAPDAVLSVRELLGRPVGGEQL